MNMGKICNYQQRNCQQSKRAAEHGFLASGCREHRSRLEAKLHPFTRF